MRTNMNGVQPPYRLPSNVIYFHDWRYVDTGLLSWRGPGDEFVSVMPPPDPVPPMLANWDWVPHAVRIQVMTGELDAEPCLTAKDLAELILFGGSVLYENGKYRFFYGSFDPDSYTNPAKRPLAGFFISLKTAESADGRNWEFPSVGSVERDGTALNNIVMETGEIGFHGGCVFADPHGPHDERYKSVFLGLVTPECLARYRKNHPDIELDPMAILPAGDKRGENYAALGIFGAVSPDGYRWAVIEDPLLIQHSDTFQAATYDEARGKYVIYPRSWFYGHRSVARTQSDDFRSFPAVEQMLWPDSTMQPYDTWYTPGFTRMPGAPDYQLLFPTRWSQLDDTFTPHFFSSPDGAFWSRTTGDVLPPTEKRPWWARCGIAVQDLVPLPDRRIGSLVLGLHVPHKYPRESPFGQCGWISWPAGRLSAVCADRDGAFALYPLIVDGREMVVNFRTKIAGAIRVEIAGQQGRSFAECDVLNGDHEEHVVTWNGVSDLGHTTGEAVQIKFRMNNAEIFSIRFR